MVITQSKRAGEQFQLAVEAAPNAMLMVDQEARIVLVNAQAERLFGYSRLELLTQDLDLLIPHRFRADHREQRTAFFASPHVRTMGQGGTLYGLRKDGTEMPLEIGLNPATSPEGTFVIASIIDITERKWAEEALAERWRLAELGADIGVALTRTENLPEILRRCAEALVRHLDVAFARIWTLNENENVLELRASAGLYRHLDGPHGRVPVGQLKIGLIAQERKPHLTNAVIGDPRVSDQEWARREGMVAFAGHPLLYGDRLVGVMAIFSRQPLSPVTLHTLATVADSIAHGIAHCGAVEALRLSDERFALAIRGTDEGIWDWNMVTNAAYHSPRFKALLGYQEDELENQYIAFESLLHPQDVGQVLKALRQHLKKRAPFQVDCRLRAKSGNYRWFHARGQALWDANGLAVRMLGSITDIHERKKAEELFRGLLESSPDPSVIINRAGAIILVNLELEKLFGYRRGELVGQPIEILVPENVRAAHVGMRDAYLEAPYLRPMGAVPNLRARREDGGEFSAEISLSPLQTVDGLFISCAIRDITKRNAMEAALRDSEERNRAVISNVGDAIITIDTGGLIQIVNPAAEKMFGYLAEELLGHNVKMLMPQSHRGAHDSGLANYLRTGEAKVIGKAVEVVGLHRNGRTFPVELRVSEYFLGDRRMFVASVRDISVRKRTEKRLAAAHEITQILAESLTFDTAIPRILRSICENLNWSSGGYWILDSQGTRLRCTEEAHAPSESGRFSDALSRSQVFRLTYRMGQGLPGRTWASKRVQWIADVSREPELRHGGIAEEEALRTGIAFPVLGGDAVRGVMDFYSDEIQEPDDELLGIFNDITTQISRFLDLRQTELKVIAHEQELAAARAIQQSLFPSDAPELEGFTIAGASQPASTTGGDYYDFIPVPNGHLLVGVGDVSGHGLGPAMLMTQVRAYLRAFGMAGMNLDTIVNLANARLAEDMIAEHFFTLFLGVLNPFSRSFVYYNAGHCPGYIFGSGGEVRSNLVSSDPPLGIDASTRYQKSMVAQLLTGDLILLLTDGIFEAFGRDGEHFGMERVFDTVRVWLHLAPDAIIANLFAAVREFSQGPLQDDMTAVVIKVAEAK